MGTLFSVVHPDTNRYHTQTALGKLFESPPDACVVISPRFRGEITDLRRDAVCLGDNNFVLVISIQ